MSNDRRAVIAAAFDDAARPRESGKRIEQQFADLKPGEHLPVGTAARIMRAMPLPQRQAAFELAERYIEEQNLGRHGSPQAVLNRPGAEGFDKFVEQMEIDDTAHRLIERRGGGDEGRPLPPIDRRAVLDAAYDAFETALDAAIDAHPED